MKKLGIFFFSILLALQIQAQNEVDALRYSQITFGGTARYMATGGAFGALGADFSTLSTNPAGIGVYKKSEFTFTPSVYVGKTAATYEETMREDMKYNFNLSNIGMVFAFNSRSSSDKPGWKGVQFGFGLNRLQNFNNRMLIEGDNSENSILYDYLNKANGTNFDELDPFDTELAFNTYLIDTVGGPSTYLSAVPNGGTMQRKQVTQKGSMNELVLSMGGNYDDRLYIGGSIGFPYLRYHEESSYSEIDEADTLNNFKSMTIYDDLYTVGTGFNFKFGLIYRVTNWVRIGAAVHTPTFFSLHDEYYRSVSSDLDGPRYQSESPNGEFNYDLTTPMRAIGSVAFIIGKYGFISADYEFVDYSEARLRGKQYKFFAENEAIQNVYTSTSNIRVGGELRLAPFAIRAGYALYGNPYSGSINNGERTSITAGIGVRDKNYFVDITYIHTMAEDDYYLYPSVPGVAANSFSANNVMLTLGLRY